MRIEFCIILGNEATLHCQRQCQQQLNFQLLNNWTIESAIKKCCCCCCRCCIGRCQDLDAFRINFNNIKSVSSESNDKMYSLWLHPRMFWLHLMSTPSTLAALVIPFRSFMCILKCIVNFMSIIWHNQLLSNYASLFISSVVSNCTLGDSTNVYMALLTHTLLLI